MTFPPHHDFSAAPSVRPPRPRPWFRLPAPGEVTVQASYTGLRSQFATVRIALSAATRARIRKVMTKVDTRQRRMVEVLRTVASA